MEMHSVTHSNSPSRPLGVDCQWPRKTNARANASKPYVLKTLLDGPPPPGRNSYSTIDTSPTTLLTSFITNDEMVINSDTNGFSDWPAILRHVETGIYGAIVREEIECDGLPDLDERSGKRNAKTSRPELRKHDENWYTGRGSPHNLALSPALYPHINDTAVCVSEIHLDSGDELDDYGISGVDDQLAAKHREIIYRTDFALSSEQCASSCCDYSDVSCSDCESEASDLESFDIGNESGEDQHVDVRLGVDGYLKTL